MSIPQEALTNPVDPADEAAAFGERMGTMINHAAVMVMMSLGHRLELFDTLATRPAFTSEELAAASGLNERYVREWLAVMTTGGVVEYEPSGQIYRLPPAHAACLTRAAAPDNMAVNAQFIPMIASMEMPLMECFRTGRGLSYEDYACFHQVMADDSYQTVVTALFDHILPLVPGLEGRLEQGIEVLDAGCGAGRALFVLARTYPNSRFTGYDLCEEAFADSRDRARELGLSNLTFRACDLRDFDEPGRYDWVASFDAVHDQPDPQGLLSAIARSLRPDGVYLMQDIAGSSHLEKNLDHPLAALLYSISCAHCTPVSIGQGGPGLGTMWGREMALEFLDRAGFASVDVRQLDHDPFNVYYIARTEGGAA